MNYTKLDTKYFYGVGRRKAATARAKYYALEGELQIFVNKKPVAVYFAEFFKQILDEATKNLNLTTGVIHIFVNGGGTSGQAQAARLAITKALIVQDPEIKPLAKSFKYTSTDIRKVLPKRPGLRKARKREQWSKR